MLLTIDVSVECSIAQSLVSYCVVIQVNCDPKEIIISKYKYDDVDTVRDVSVKMLDMLG